MIHSTLRDQNRSFHCQVNGNIMLSKCVDEIRLSQDPYPQRLGAKIIEKSRDKGGNFQTYQYTMVKNCPKILTSLWRLENYKSYILLVNLYRSFKLPYLLKFRYRSIPSRIKSCSLVSRPFWTVWTIRIV